MLAAGHVPPQCPLCLTVLVQQGSAGTRPGTQGLCNHALAAQPTSVAASRRRWQHDCRNAGQLMTNLTGKITRTTGLSLCFLIAILFSSRIYVTNYVPVSRMGKPQSLPGKTMVRKDIH